MSDKRPAHSHWYKIVRADFGGTRLVVSRYRRFEDFYGGFHSWLSNQFDAGARYVWVEYQPPKGK